MLAREGTSGGAETQADDKFCLSMPQVSLPKGGGAVRGLGKKFVANPVTDTGSMTGSIATSPGRSGFGPQLSLSYDSGSGNGPFGYGRGLSLPAITRKTDKALPHHWDAMPTESTSAFRCSKPSRGQAISRHVSYCRLLNKRACGPDNAGQSLLPAAIVHGTGQIAGLIELAQGAGGCDHE